VIIEFSNIDGPPVIIDGIVLSPRSVKVTWDSLSTISFVVGYIISYNSAESFASPGSMLVDKSTISAAIDGLEEFVSYNYTVRAVYGGGG